MRFRRLQLIKIGPFCDGHCHLLSFQDPALRGEVLKTELKFSGDLVL